MEKLNAQAVVSHDSFVHTPETKLGLTDNQHIVMDIADVMGIPPQYIDDTYLSLCKKVCSLLGISPEITAGLQSLAGIQKILPIGIEIVHAPAAAVDEDDSQVAIMNAALGLRNRVYSFIDDVTSFITHATNSGLVPPSNPFVVISELDAKRRNAMGMIVQNAGTEFMPQGNSAFPIQVDKTTADDIVFNIGAFVQLLLAQKNGTLDLSTVAKRAAAQISSFSFSLDGFGSSGDTAVDLLRFIPSADELRAQKNIELLASFDFSKRVARLVFVCDYIAAGQKLGSIIGWKKIADASGYILKKKNVFDITQQEIYLSNDVLVALGESLRDYVQTFVMSFYDRIDQRNVCLYLDQGVSQDSCYQYSVRGFQNQKQSQGQLFTVASTPNSFVSVTRAKVESTLTDLAKKYFGQSATSDDINPWPVLSEQIFGDSRFDWVLSAVNSRISINRGDAFEDSRKFYYLGARLSDLLTMMDRGLFVVPNDVNAVVTNVNNSISNFGLSQTVGELLSDSGIIYYFEGSEEVIPSGFSRAGTMTVDTSPLLKAVFSAVDTDNAILDLRALGTNIPSILNSSRSAESFQGNTELPVVTNVRAAAQELTVPDIGQISTVVAQGDVQYIGSVPSADDSRVDLMTFEGLSKLIRTVRLFADAGPGRGGGSFISDGVLPPQDLPPPVSMQDMQIGPNNAPDVVVKKLEETAAAAPVDIKQEKIGVNTLAGKFIK